MIELDDWSSLVTVNYPGGMCGDFIATMIDNNFQNPSDRNFSFNDRSRYFHEKDPFNMNLKTFLFFYDDISTSNIKINRPYVQRLLNVYNLVNADSKSKISDNLRQYCYDNFKDNFYRRRVFSAHSVEDVCMPLQHTFPKSKNIFLHTDNKQFVKLSRVLFAHKTGYHFYKLDENGNMDIGGLYEWKGSIPDMVKKSLRLPPNINYFNEFPIDVYKLIFEGVSYDQSLSDLLEEDIILSKSEIEFYRDNNIKILKDYNIDLYQEYEEEKLFKLMSEAIIDLAYKNDNQ